METFVDHQIPEVSVSSKINFDTVLQPSKTMINVAYQ